MFGTILEQSIFLYVIAATGICGIVAKLIMDGFLKGLVRGAGSMKSTKKKALVEIRKRYEELSYLDVGIRDTRSFVEKYIYKLKLGKSYVSSWNSFCSNMMILAAGTGLIGTWWEYRTGSSVFASVQIGMWGIVACGVMQMVYNIFNTQRKCEMLSAELVSYMNNSLANRLKREQEKQMESSKQKADDRSRSGLKQTAAAIIEPNVIDIDAALERRPQLILVDELAHSNAQGCRHTKRYQDVEELLKAGIDVYTTVNVQHLESLHDLVASITQISVNERIPDSVFDSADQVELVDIEPDELVKRLQAGKVYRERQAKQALENFFATENLAALREIAMRSTADQLNRTALQAGKGKSAKAGEPILVCLSSAPSNAKVIRTAARMAEAFHSGFTALFVQTPETKELSGENLKRLRGNLRLAEQM